MSRIVFFVFVCFLHYVSGASQLCGNNSELSCTTEIFGQDSTDYDSCRMKVYPSNSHECGAMTFGHFSPNTHIGGVTLKPYIMTVLHDTFYMNHTVLNITFSNIKWKTMKFRFQDKFRRSKNHCRTIEISNQVKIDDKSVLYYDCYWPKTDHRDGQTHTLDFEATADDGSVNRGQYYFNIPSAEMLSATTTEERWKPFIYIEIFPRIMRLHITPPPKQLRITGYNVTLVTHGGNVKVSTILPIKNDSDVTYDYDYIGDNDSFAFVVTPLHLKCETGTGIGCQSVQSPAITITSGDQSRNICIASITALIVTFLFAYYVVVKLVRKHCCHGMYTGVQRVPTPPKILLIYSNENRLHTKCVASFVDYLRFQGFDIMFDGDISSTKHGDPFIWAHEAVSSATHIIYVVGPAEEANHLNIYDQPIINVNRNVDALLLSLIRPKAATANVDLINVLFDHSQGPIPVETMLAKKFTLTRDWSKFISHLSKNLDPRNQIMQTETGRCFWDTLNKANDLLRGKNDEKFVKCEQMLFNSEKNLML